MSTKGKNTHVATVGHFTREQMLTLLRTARAASERDYLAILVMFTHAMRVSEICGLRTSQVDIANGYITVKRLKGSRTTLHELETGAGEPLLDERTALTAYMAHVKEGDRLFPICRQHMYTLFVSYVQAAGLPRHLARVHNVKHSSLQGLAPHVPLPMLQRFSGHVSLSSLGRYIEPTMEQANAAVRTARMAVSA
jgi:integrase